MNPAAPVMTTRCFIMCFPSLSFRLSARRCLTDNRSIRVFVEETPEKRQPHDFQIEANRPVFDVVEVVLDPLFERCVTAPPVDLRPASQARLDLVSQHVLRDLVLELLDEY